MQQKKVLGLHGRNKVIDSQVSLRPDLSAPSSSSSIATSKPSTFRSKARVLEYELVLTPEGRVVCPHCQDNFNGIDRLIGHILAVASRFNEYLCPLCIPQASLTKTTPASITNFKRHVKRHFPPEEHCLVEGCDYSATTKSQLTSHTNTAHRPQTLPCTCGKYFDSISTLNNHMRNYCPHRKPSQYICKVPGCPHPPFQSLIALRRHSASHRIADSMYDIAQRTGIPVPLLPTATTGLPVPPPSSAATVEVSNLGLTPQSLLLPKRPLKQQTLQFRPMVKKDVFKDMKQRDVKEEDIKPEDIKPEDIEWENAKQEVKRSTHTIIVSSDSSNDEDPVRRSRSRSSNSNSNSITTETADSR